MAAQMEQTDYEAEKKQPTRRFRVYLRKLMLDASKEFYLEAGEKEFTQRDVQLTGILVDGKLQVVQASSSKVASSSKQHQDVRIPTSTANPIIVDEAYKIIPDNAKLTRDGSVNMQEGLDSHSTQSLIEVVEVNQSHKLSLTGPGTTSQATWFKEYSYVERKRNGVPLVTLYLYESHKYPGHFIRWYHDDDQPNLVTNDTIDCEPHIENPQESTYVWIVKPRADGGDGFQYKWLMAPVFGVDLSQQHSSYYMAFKDDKPIITQDVNFGEKQFLITPSN